jgi:6-pyruvoyltetrahydropterin/6-carboxytetrahydropterin synthase
MIYLTRKFAFSSSHQLVNPTLSDEENRQIFGKCANPGGHGHNYELEVTLRGDLDPKSGMLINVGQLKEVVHREVIAKIDHRHFNTDCELLRGIIPTSENLLVKIWEVLENKIPRGELCELKLHETDRNMFVYRGEGVTVANYSEGEEACKN